MESDAFLFLNLNFNLNSTEECIDISTYVSCKQLLVGISTTFRREFFFEPSVGRHDAADSATWNQLEEHVEVNRDVEGHHTVAKQHYDIRK